MNLADVFTVLFVIAGFLTVFVGYWLMASALWPRMVERCASHLGRAPVLTTLVGLVSLVPLVGIGLTVSGEAPNGLVKIFGLALALFALLLALFGSAGLALRIGCGLKSARDEQEPWRRVLRGGIVLGLTFVLPVLGTFIVMPFAFISGFGAFVFTLLSRQSPEPPGGSAHILPVIAP